MAKKDSTDVFMTELDAYLFGEGTHYEIYNKIYNNDEVHL